MKGSGALLRLESVIVNEKSIINNIMQNDAGVKAVSRIANHKKKEKTHTITLAGKKLSWENRSGQGWHYEFESTDTANEWWNKLISPRSKN
jgi:hypothetical protein